MHGCVDDFAIIMMHEDGTVRCAQVNRHGRARGSKEILNNLSFGERVPAAVRFDIAGQSGTYNRDC